MPRSPAPELIVLPETAALPALPFLLLRDHRRTLRITVQTNGGVTVKAPFHVRVQDVLNAVQRKRAWIESKRRFFREHILPPPRLWAEGEVVYYLGRPFRLRFAAPIPARRRRAPAAELLGNELVILPGAAPLTPDAVRRAVERWRQRLAERLLRRRLLRLYAGVRARLDVPCPTLRVRSLKRRWGSCSTRGGITLARQLSAAPLACVDYVILHELCHLRHMNHSPRFYALLEELLPGAAIRARELRLWGLEHAGA